jgi:hypothetical protein
LLLLGVMMAIAYTRHSAKRAALDVRGLYVMLRRGEEPAGPELKAPGRWADAFRFAIRQDAVSGPRLDTPKPGDRLFTAKRKLSKGHRTDIITIETDDGEKHDLGVGNSSLPLDNGLVLAFRDKRRARSPGRRSPAAGASAPTLTKPGQPDSRAFSSGPSEDPWL